MRADVTGTCLYITFEHPAMYLPLTVTHALTIIQGVNCEMYSGVSYNEQDNNIVPVPAFMTTRTDTVHYTERVLECMWSIEYLEYIFQVIQI